MTWLLRLAQLAFIVYVVKFIRLVWRADHALRDQATG